MLASESTLAAINTKVPSLGAAASAASLPVALATDSPFVLANRPSATLVFPAQHTPAATATQLAAQACVQGVLVQAPSTNTVSVWIGGSDVTSAKGIELAAGDRVFFPVANLNQLYSITTAGGVTAGVKLNLMCV